MSRLVRLDPADPGAVAAAARAAEAVLAAGGLVVLPTETVFGIAARPDLPAATARLFQVKRRDRGLALPVLAAAADEALSLGRAGAAARALGAVFWPGPLTLVLERSDRSRGWDLGARPDSIGVRVPALALPLALLGRVGPLAVTSANPSGSPPAADESSLLASFADVAELYLLPRGGIRGGGRASTVVDCTARRPRLTREGPIGAARLAEVLRGFDPEGESIDFSP